MRRIRVLLADDHALFREGLASIISAHPDFEVVGEAANGVEALIKARELQPDLILMDIAMPGCDGLEATRLIKQTLPAVIIVMLTVQAEDEKLFEAIKSGAQGYLLKDIHARDLLNLLRGAIRGEAAISPTLATRVLAEFRRLSQGAEHLPAAESDAAALTPREREILSLLAQGVTNKEIAERLVISLHTTKSHIRNILAKLHVSTRYEAARQARQKGLLS